jgi:hypothetical protein
MTNLESWFVTCSRGGILVHVSKINALGEDRCLSERRKIALKYAAESGECGTPISASLIH